MFDVSHIITPLPSEVEEVQGKKQQCIGDGNIQSLTLVHWDFATSRGFFHRIISEASLAIRYVKLALGVSFSAGLTLTICLGERPLSPGYSERIAADLWSEEDLSNRKEHPNFCHTDK